jgi:hypothetical protein
MNKLLLILFPLLLNGCIMLQFSTNLSLAGHEGNWILYIKEPTTNFQCSAHALMCFNVPEDYRILMPAKNGRLDSSLISVYKKDGHMDIVVDAGEVVIDNCEVKIALFSGGKPLSFNGVHHLPSYDCKPR